MLCPLNLRGLLGLLDEHFEVRSSIRFKFWWFYKFIIELAPLGHLTEKEFLVNLWILNLILNDYCS